MKKDRSRRTETGERDLAKDAGIGAVIALATTLLMLRGFSALLAGGAAPAALLDDFVIVSVLLGAAAGALWCAGKRAGGVVTAGAVTALAYILLLLLCSLTFGGKDGGPQMIVKEMIASVAGGCFGGVLRLHKKTQKSRLRKR